MSLQRRSRRPESNLRVFRRPDGAYLLPRVPDLIIGTVPIWQWRGTMGADEGKTATRMLEDLGIPAALDGVERTMGQRSRNHPWPLDRPPRKFVVDDECPAVCASFGAALPPGLFLGARTPRRCVRVRPTSPLGSFGGTCRTGPVQEKDAGRPASLGKRRLGVV